MSISTVLVTVEVLGVPVDPVSIVLSDEAETYGIKRLDTGASIVAPGALLDRVAQGYYKYSFTDPAYDLVYEWSAKIYYDGSYTYDTGQIFGSPTPSDQLISDSQIMTEMMVGLESRWRFSKSDNMLENAPTVAEMEEAIWDAVGEINSAPAETRHTLGAMYSGLHNNDMRWRTLLYYGAAKNIFQMLMAHWNSEGFDAEIGDLSATSKFGDFQSVLGDVTTNFNERLEKLKMSSQKHISGIAGNSSSSIFRHKRL